MQTIIQILAALVLLAFLGLLISLIRNFWQKPITIDPLDELEEKYEDDNTEDSALCEDGDDLLVFDYTSEDEVDFNLDIDFDEDGNIFLPHEPKQQDVCAVSQVDGYYNQYGVIDLADFLINSSSSISKYKNSAKYLLRWVIAYARFFSGEAILNEELLLKLLMGIEENGITSASAKMDVLEEIKKSSEQCAMLENMRSDLSSFVCFMPLYEDNHDIAINLAIEALLPYVSGYTIERHDLGFAWKLTNHNKNIASKARQRDWQRQAVAALHNIEETLENMRLPQREVR